MDESEQLEIRAVEAAIKADWEKAITLNLLLLEHDKNNEQIFLRLGFAYIQKAEYELAKKYYRKALRIQPKQAVARQYLERIEILEQGKLEPQKTKQAFDPGLFIESSGKTKCTPLSNLGQKRILAQLYIGEKIVLKIKRRRVEARTEKEDYIGTVPDDISKRLILFIKAKSTYSAYIKDATLTKVTIFIREEKKGRTISHHISFPLNMQKNMNQLSSDTQSEQTDDHTEDVDDEMDDWEKIVANVGEEKEETIDIQKEDLEDDEEEDE